ncbi:MAG: hypothetical protein RLZZ248_1031 [Bacteroidota bacterium]
MNFNFSIFLCLFAPFSLYPQEIEIFGGNGKSPHQIMVSDQSFVVYNIEPGDKTDIMNGKGMTNHQNRMGRLLRQATLGLTEEDMLTYYSDTPEQWIDNQMKFQPYNFVDFSNAIVAQTRGYLQERTEEEIEFLLPYQSWEFRVAWWKYLMESKDHLRQKIAYVLSQIFVISDAPQQIFDHGVGLASYTGLLTNHAFGNFRDLLFKISLHPSMGIFLSHFNNSREIPYLNIHPDENYAREIMQLFTIGLYELELTGIPKRDEEGHLIPTYDQEDIRHLAKVFTGLGPGKAGLFAPPNQIPYFGMGRFNTDFTHPMVMYEEYHDKTEKTIVGDFVIPANQKGMEDIELAIDHLFNHPNVGPFLGKQLIQKLVTSNPSPQYVKDIALVFNNNGKGERGDLGAVIKAILLHPEASSCASLLDPQQGKMQEPFIRYLEFLKLIHLQPHDEDGSTFYSGGEVEWMTTQDLFRAPTVFNFYKPNFSPNGPLREKGLLGPEFQIHNSTTSLTLINHFHYMSNEDYGMGYSWLANPNEEGYYKSDKSYLLKYTPDAEALVNKIDRLLTRGQMTTRTREIIKTAIEDIDIWDGNAEEERLARALFLTLISPDFVILK